MTLLLEWTEQKKSDLLLFITKTVFPTKKEVQELKK